MEGEQITIEEVQKELDKREPKKQLMLTVTKIFKENAVDDGINLAAQYDYQIDATVPELAFAIANMAYKMPENGFGENSDIFFVQMIDKYLNALKAKEKPEA